MAVPDRKNSGANLPRVRRRAMMLALRAALLALGCLGSGSAVAQGPQYYRDLESAPPVVPIAPRSASVPQRPAYPIPQRPAEQQPPPARANVISDGLPRLTRLPQVSSPAVAARSTLEPSTTPRGAQLVTTAAPHADTPNANAIQPQWNRPTNANDHADWTSVLSRPILGQSYPISVSVEQLTIDALGHSLQLRVNSLQPMIENEVIARAAATFDWNTFITSKWQELNQPSSTTLQTGGPFIFKDHRLSTESGVQKRTQFGGDLLVGQTLSAQQTNSRFFNPQHQATTQLRVNFTQPLLRGAGQFYNRSVIVVAELRADVSRQNYIEQLQDHLLAVNQTYWDLYFARGNWLRQEKLYQQAAKLAAQLQTRENVDGAKDQILRAETTAAQRKALMIRAQKLVLDAQAKLRLLVNSPLVMDAACAEFVTADAPLIDAIPVTFQDAFCTAVQFRPELIAAMRRIQDARVRLGIAENEVLPSLNLIMETYLNGLDGNYDIGGSLRSQFKDVDPGYVVGLELKTPFGQRAARANQRKISWERAQLEADFQLVNEQIWQAVAEAYRELQTTFREAQANREAARHAEAQLDYLEKRRELTPLTDRSSALFLQDVFRAQEQSASADLAYLRSQITYAQAVTNLKRSMGYLLYEVR